jgi:hypothetical protein
MELRKTEFEVQKQHTAQGARESRKIRVNSALYAHFDGSFYALSIARKRPFKGGYKASGSAKPQAGIRNLSEHICGRNLAFEPLQGQLADV